jgi:hypothetical protein
VTLSAKKKHELMLVEIFLQAAHLSGVPHPGERPDVVLELPGGQRVGLEVTGLTDPDTKASSSAMKRLEVETEQLLARQRVFVFVVWKTAARLDVARDRVRAVASSLAQLVLEMRQRSLESAGGTVLRRYPDLKPLLHHVALFDEPDGPSVSATSETHWMNGSTDLVQRALDAKESKLKEYRATMDLDQWLLIVSASDSAQNVAPHMLPPAHVYRSNFDRAFVLDAGWRQALELRLVRP